MIKIILLQPFFLNQHQTFEIIHFTLKIFTSYHFIVETAVARWLDIWSRFRLFWGLTSLLWFSFFLAEWCNNQRNEYKKICTKCSWTQCFSTGCSIVRNGISTETVPMLLGKPIYVYEPLDLRKMIFKQSFFETSLIL